MRPSAAGPHREYFPWRRLLCVLGWLWAISPAPVAAELTQTVVRVKPSIVAVGTFQRTRNPPFRFLGTGFVVGSGRVVATNAHVVPASIAEGQIEALVIVIPGDMKGTVRKVSKTTVDANSDLALLSIEGEPLPALSLADEGVAREGQSIAFTGFPIGSVLGLSPVTHRGIVSAITPIGIPQGNSRELNSTVIKRLAEGAFKVYQLDATAYPGNSGSPVFDAETGEVLGVVNMAFVKKTKESVLSDPSGITYAIPISYLRALLKDAE